MNRNNAGNILIESIASLMILSIALVISMTTIINVNRSNNKRNNYDEVNRVTYSIMNEIKYNYSYQQIKDEIIRLKSNNCINIKYTRDILQKLTTVELFSLERSNEIKIEVIREDYENKIVEMRISINVEINGEVIACERSFDKLQWMHI